MLFKRTKPTTQPTSCIFPGLHEWPGRSQYMLATLNPAVSGIYKKSRRILNSHAPVLLRGESGCGKEVMAHALHYAGLSRLQRLLSVRCDTASESSLSQELLAAYAALPKYNGNNGIRVGAQHQALAVDLLLKNVEALSSGLQRWLVQLLQDKILHDPENGTSLRLSLRLLATSRYDLLQLVEQGRFREDLYYRLTTYEFVLPSLCARKEDLPAFITHFLNKAARPNPGREITCSTNALAQLATHSWPGNLRELKETLSRTIVKLAEGQTAIEQINFLAREDYAEKSSRRNEFAPQTVMHERTYESTTA